jgi:hypothetical protein
MCLGQPWPATRPAGRRLAAKFPLDTPAHLPELARDVIAELPHAATDAVGQPLGLQPLAPPGAPDPLLDPAATNLGPVPNPVKDAHVLTTAQRIAPHTKRAASQQPRGPLFQVEQEPLTCQAACIAGEAAVLADHAVARDDRRQSAAACKAPIRMCNVNRYTRNIIRVRIEEREASRDRSSAIFGNRYFVDVVLAVNHLSGDDHARVTMRMVASETTISDSLVRQVMERLHLAGLITEQSRTGGPRSPRYFRVRQGPLWAGVLDACVASIGDTGTESPPAS